jgi:hypothetical protein
MDNSTQDKLPIHMTTVQCIAAFAITVVSLAMIIAHVIWPGKIALDNGTLILFGVAALPWLTLFWKKIKIGSVEAEKAEDERLDDRKAKAKEVSNFGPSLVKNLQTITSEEVVKKLVSASRSEDVRNYLQEQVTRIEEDIKRKSCISVDLRAFKKELGIQTYPVAALSDIGELVDVVYFALNGAVRPYAYGKDWVLRNKADGKVIKGIRMLAGIPIGTPAPDHRSLNEIGITVGMELEAVKP